MNTKRFILSSIFGLFFLCTGLFAQDFQGQAYYFSKSTLDLGRWGSRLSEAQKKQVQERLKNRLEKTYILTFSVEESLFKEDEKLDAISGATDSWGKNFTPGKQYKNVKTNTLLQDQEFYGKQFLVKDQLLKLEWNMTADTKQIGEYMCMKAVAVVPSEQLSWYDFSWDKLRNQKKEEDKNESNNEVADGDTSKIQEVNMTQIVAWYTPQIPVSHGPLEYWGLPGLILEVNAGNTTMLCSKIVMNPTEKNKIEAPDKGKEVTKMEYQEIITTKMAEMRDMYSGRRGR
ncbi:GLPGLI family protein [Hanstruepera marina]|uniref:GLPGLI family protein n=1 Tax=Hanstruepera marina TaxID=2873265 RepID=UPI001CA60A42|nr:GLPGLI family protein [Hanstruepera marina]